MTGFPLLLHLGRTRRQVKPTCKALRAVDPARTRQSWSSSITAVSTIDNGTSNNIIRYFFVTILYNYTPQPHCKDATVDDMLELRHLHGESFSYVPPLTNTAASKSNWCRVGLIKCQHKTGEGIFAKGVVVTYNEVAYEVVAERVMKNYRSCTPQLSLNNSRESDDKRD
jgi:hypothetical protein